MVGGDDDHAFIGLEPVHLDEQLVERLFALVIAAAEARAAMATDRVDLVDEDDAGRILLGLLEHVTDTARAHTDEHLDEIGAGNREERHVRLAGHGARGERLARSGRAHKQHAARDSTTQPLEFLGIAQEFDDFLQIFLGLVDAGDILEGHAPMRLGEKLCLRLAESHGTPRPALHLSRQEDPGCDEDQDRQPVQEERDKPGGVVLRRLRVDLHAALLQGLHEVGIIWGKGPEGGAILVAPGDLVTGDHDTSDATRLRVGEQLAIGDFLSLLTLIRALEERDQGEHEKEDDHPEGEVSEIRVHLDPFVAGCEKLCGCLRARRQACNLGAARPLAK